MKGPRGICVLSANGAVSNVTIRQPGSSGGLLTYEVYMPPLFSIGTFPVTHKAATVDLHRSNRNLKLTDSGTFP